MENNPPIDGSTQIPMEDIETHSFADHSFQENSIRSSANVLVSANDCSLLGAGGQELPMVTVKVEYIVIWLLKDG